MRSIKSLLILVLLVAVVAASIYVGSNRGLIKHDQLAKLGLKKENIETLKENVDKEALISFSENAKDQSETLIQRGGVVLGESKEFIDTQITASEKDEPIANKTLEYARYLYCKQVVTEFEEK